MIYRGGDRDTIEQRKGSFKPYNASEEPYFTGDDAAKAANRCTGVDQRTRSQLPQLDRARAQRRPRREQALADPPPRPAEAGERLQRRLAAFARTQARRLLRTSIRTRCVTIIGACAPCTAGDGI